MDFEEASRILNMELLGLTPDTFDRVPDEVVEAAYAALPNSPDLMVEWDGETGQEWITPPDAYDETTDTERDYQLIVNFDAQTELEARLAVDALVGFAKRRLNLAHPVFTARIDN